MNEYLDLLKAAPAATGAAPTDNPYLDMLRSVEDSRRAQLAATLTTAVDVNPDEYAKQKQTAGYLGVPTGVVAALPDESARRAQVQGVRQDIGANATLQKRYSDADFAKLAHDDSGVLSSIGAAVRYLVSAPDTNRNLVQDIAAGYQQASGGAAGVFRAAAEHAALGAEGLYPGLRYNEEAGALGGNPLRRVAEGFTRIGQRAGAKQKELSPPTDSLLEGGVSSGVQSLVGNTLMLPLAILGGPAGEGAALLGMSAQTGGQSYNDAREKGLTPIQSLPFATSQAVIEFATEKIPMSRLLGDLKAGTPIFKTIAHQMAAEVPGEQLATILQDMNEWAILHPEKPFKDYLAERPSAAVQTFLATLVGVGGNVTLGQALQTAGDNALGLQRNTLLADAGGQNLQKLFALAAQSKLRERDAATFGEVVQEMADEPGGAPASVRFDAHLLVGEGGLLNQDQIAQLPSVAAQIPEALAAGGEIVVPIGELTAAVAGTPLEQKLLEHARIGENELSQAEAKAAADQAETFLQQEAERVISMSKEVAVTRAAADSVMTQVLDQLNTAKRFTSDVNAAYATLVRDFYTTMAARLGTTADALYAERPLRIVSTAQQGLTLVDQPAYHGSPTRGIDKFSTQHIGTGEGAQAYGWGLYFAGRKKVAEFYRKSLTSGSPAPFTKDGKAISATEDLAEAYYKPGSIVRGFGGADKVLQFQRGSNGNWAVQVVGVRANGEAMPNQRPRWHSTFPETNTLHDALQSDGWTASERGQLYTVDVPEDNQLLSYEDRIADQPEAVRKALEKLGFQGTYYYVGSREFTTLDTARRYVTSNNLEAKVESRATDAEGKDVYERLSEQLGSDEAASRALAEAGIPGLRYRDTFSRRPDVTEKTYNYVIFHDDAVQKTGELYQAAVANETEQDKTNSLGDARISPRLPTAKKATEDALGGTRLQPDLETAKRDPAVFAHNVGLMVQYPNFEGLEGTPEEQAEKMIQSMVDNLLWLHDGWKPEYRDRSKMWYVGGNRIAHRWAARFGVTPEQVAAVIAATSPQKDWLQNVSLAERILEAVVNNSDTPWDAKMTELVKSRDWGKKEVTDPSVYEGKTLRDLHASGTPGALLDMAIWIRAWDEANNPMKARVITPEGGFADRFDAGKSGKEIGLRWQSFPTIVKTLQVLANNDRAVLSEIIGANHKVRSFFNNIIAPYAGDDVTIDTHAVAAALLRPLGSSSTEVFHNFGSGEPGSPGPKNSAITGLYGTYSIYAEAYRRAAEQRGVLPREMQSITWEAVRGLFRPEQKNEKIRTEADRIWRSVAAGEIDANAARDQVAKLVGGIADPAWVRSPAGADEAPVDSSYARELPRDGGAAGAPGRGAGVDAAAGVQQGASTGVLNQISPQQAKDTNVPVDLPTDPNFAEAVANTPGAQITPDGLLMTLVRFQRPEQEGAQAIRTGVFYLPAGSTQVSGYKGENKLYGGTERFEGQTLLRRPLFVKGATGGKAPAAAYNALRGKGAYESMRSDVLNAGRNYAETREEKAKRIAATLEKHNADPRLALEIVNNSTQGNQLAYAVQENIVAHAVRAAGYDAVVGYGKAKGANRITEVFDVREQTYPSYVLNPEVHDAFVAMHQGPRGTFNPSTLTISLLESSDLSTFLHETGHFFLEMVADFASQANAPADVAADMQTLLKWFGVKDLETWNGYSLDKQRKYHERFAESFEQYLLEGKAPSAELQPLFQRFRAWLTNVYRSLSDFMRGRDLQLSDEVRQVFDRMIASETAIKEMETLRGFEPLFKSAEQAGMTPQEWAAYQSKNREATDAAIDKMQARSLRDMRWTTNARSKALKALQRDVATKRKGVEAEVAGEVAKEPIYQAMRWLRKGEMTTPDGEEVKAEKGFRLNTDALGEMYPESMLDRPDLEKLKGMTAANGLHPDMVAEMFGFSSGDELVRSIIGAEPMSSVVEGQTDRRMLERFGDLATEAGIQRAADEAVHSEARGRFVATELKALQEADAPVEKTPRGGSVNVMVKAAKDFAATIVGRRKVRELRPGQYIRNEARAAKMSLKALSSKDTKGAIVAKRDQLLNHYAARATNAALDEIDNARTYLRRFDKDSVRTKVPAEYLDQIDKLLERIDLRKVSEKDAAKRAKLADWIKAQADIGIEVDLPAYVLEDSQLKPYQDLTVEEFRGLVDTIRQIEHLGRLKNKLLTAKDQREFEATRDAIAQSIRDNAGDRETLARTATTLTGKALQSVKNFGYAHIKAATLARVLDGGKDGGPMWEYFVRSANERGDLETSMRAKATRELAEIIEPWLKRGRANVKAFFPTIDRSLTRQEQLVIALNVGNEGNLQRLLGGEGWTMQQLQPVLESLQASDWQTVQSIWNHFEKYRPLIAEKQKRVYGKEPDWIEPRPFEVTTAKGEKVKVDGGYYPIKYDPAASVRAEEHADAEGAKRQLQGAYGAATTRRSFTKSRAEEVVGRPLLYDLSGVYGGVNDVIHDLAWHEWLIDANRLLKSTAIDQAIRSTYGPEVVRQFKSWRDAIAEGEAGSQEAIDMALGRLRQSVSVAGLGFNVMSALMQPLGLTQSITRIGAGWVGKGLTHYVGAPITATREANGKSTFMANRSRTRFRELNELRNRVQGQTAFKRVIAQHAYTLMLRVQQMVDVPTWWGAYEKAQAAGQDEARSVALADQAVIDSQGGGQTKDLSAIERGGPAQKLFTVFYSFMNTALNLGVASKMGPDGKAKFAANMLLLYVVPAVLGSMLKDALTPGDAGGDDPEKLARKLASDQLSYLLGLVVVGREFGELSKNMIGGSRPHDYTGPAGLRAIVDMYQFGKQAGQGEFDDQFRKATVNLASDFMGLPGAQINRTITGTKAIAEGKTQNPFAAILGYQEPH